MITNSLFQNFDTTKTIHEAFSPEYRSLFVALNPFNRKIFSDSYDPIHRLELTYPLWESVSWNQVASEIGFNSIHVLANALTDHTSSLYRELKDYLNEKELEWPAVNDEVIPVEIIVTVLKQITSSGVREVVKSYTQDNHFGDERIEQRFEITVQNLFEAVKSLHYCPLILIPEVSISVLRPMKDDCPYTLILSQNGSRIFKELGVEGFEADEKTRFCWWK